MTPAFVSLSVALAILTKLRELEQIVSTHPTDISTTGSIRPLGVKQPEFDPWIDAQQIVLTLTLTLIWHLWLDLCPDFDLTLTLTGSDFDSYATFGPMFTVLGFCYVLVLAAHDFFDMADWRPQSKSDQQGSEEGNTAGETVPEQPEDGISLGSVAARDTELNPSSEGDLGEGYSVDGATQNKF